MNNRYERLFYMAGKEEFEYAKRAERRKLLNIKLDREVHEQLEKFCAESGMTKTMATEKILAQFFEDYFKRPEDSRKLFR